MLGSGAMAACKICGRCHCQHPQRSYSGAHVCATERGRKGAWIRGHGWAEDVWGAMPHCSWLDPVCPDNPVFLTRRDNHMAVVNSVAGVHCDLLA